MWILRELGIDPLLGEIKLSVTLCPPDNRKRDIDNPMKALLDSLQHGLAFLDDNQIKKMDVTFGSPCPPSGVAIVSLETI